MSSKWSIPALMGASYGFDSSAQALFTAAQITNPQVQLNINRLIVKAKTHGWWDLDYAIWGLAGDNLAQPYSFQYKFNWKDPQDTDAAYRIIFNGTNTYDANGFTGGGTSADYADTRLNGSTVLSKTNSSWSVYLRTNGTLDMSDYGSASANICDIIVRWTDGNFYHDIPDVNDRFSFANGSSLGYFMGSLGASDIVIYRNGSSIGSKGIGASRNYDNTNMLFGIGGTGGSLRPSTRNAAFWTIGQDYTAAMALIKYNDIQEFQIAMGRSV